MAPVAGDSPPKMAACRAGFCPSPAETTLPMMHSSTCAGSTPARFTASRTTMAPSCGALKSDKLPWNFPTGVRQPEMITTSSKEALDQAPANISLPHYRTCEAGIAHLQPFQQDLASMLVRSGKKARMTQQASLPCHGTPLEPHPQKNFC